MARRILRALLPLLALGVGLAVFIGLVRSRPSAERAARPSLGAPVRVLSAKAADHPLAIQAQGQVIPARQVVLAAELTGRVIWQNPELVPGGILREGDLLARIDPRDFRTALEREHATLETNRVLVQTEERRRAVAEREWQLMEREGVSASAEGRSLSLREPQLRSAQATVAASQAQLSQARLTLSRTTLRAPFNATVLDRSVELGQLVGPSVRLATLVGTDDFWVQVALPLEALSSIRVGEDGSTARVVQVVGERTIERTGHVVRLLKDLDPAGRMARVLVEIDDPLGLELDPEARGLPLLLGASVRVGIDAGVARSVFEIPRAALRDGDVAWIVHDGRLAVRPVRIAWRREDTVLVASGLADGDLVIVSPFAGAVQGMAVRVVEDGNGVTPRGTRAARKP
ncbi:MAG: efflux RND transporter periplasmic adaptor subunit [Deltaproteobacteria bacterium]|nr:efflux RND transporter periplasmic adaptor subunit [Deltaproteobacteria bacterium]